jgi:N-acetylmuramoyl-L-alanine amidase
MKTGKDLFALLNQHKGEQYHLGVLVPKANPTYRGSWDCAEVVAWGYYQLTGKLYGCANNQGNPNSADAYTGYLARDAKVIGKIIPINDAFKTPGALLLRVAASGVTGHVVVSDGKGSTIEAHSTKMGVINSVVTGRRWDYGILFPGLDYSPTPGVDPTKVNQYPAGVVYRFTSPLMHDTTGHDPIKRLQIRLNSLGFPCGNPDGAYGSKTMFAVRQFQLSKGNLVADGEVGKETLAALGITL